MNPAVRREHGRLLRGGKSAAETVSVYRECLKCVSCETWIPDTVFPGTWITE